MRQFYNDHELSNWGMKREVGQSVETFSESRHSDLLYIYVYNIICITCERENTLERLQVQKLI